MRGGGARPRPSIWAQIESVAGVAAAEAIAAEPRIDALVVGTADLSFALGAPLDPAAPSLLEGIDTIRLATARGNVALGIAGALDGLPESAFQDASVLVHGTDATICGKAVDDTAAWLRSVAP
jgi:2-keto-3-deoxy-L-rhamnonate aldolase RhmA